MYIKHEDRHWRYKNRGNWALPSYGRTALARIIKEGSLKAVRKSVTLSFVIQIGRRPFIMSDFGCLKMSIRTQKRKQLFDSFCEQDVHRA